MKEPNQIMALTVMGGILAVPSAYGSLGPSLQGLRSRDTSDVTGRQQLMDADIIVGGTAALAGTLTSLISHSWYPLVALFGTFLIVSAWHHIVLNSTNEHVERKS